MTRTYADLSSPVGRVRVIARDGAICRVDFETHASFDDSPRGDERPDDPLLAQALGQLREYFAGERTAFELPLARDEGDAFQRSVWELIDRIPYGRTATYGDLARELGEPGMAREVGAAVGSNPLAIVRPCHRVVGKDGRLVGYAGGLRRKQFLLSLETGRADRPSDRLF